MTIKVDVTEIANRIVTCGVLAKFLPQFKDYPRSGLGVAIPAARMDDYRRGVHDLFLAEKQLLGSYSIKTFEERVLSFIAPFIHRGTKPTKEDADTFLEELLNVPFEGHDVYRPIFGVEFEPGTNPDPVELGPFTVYHTHNHAEALDEVMRRRRSLVLLDKSEHYLIRTRVESRDGVKALELADALFDRFECAIKFMLGPASEHIVSVGRSNEPESKRAIVLNSQSGSSESGRKSRAPNVDISDPFFTAQEYGFERFWEIFGALSNNELMKKVLLAVDWLGQSIAETVISSAFVKATIALEVLFTPPKEFISASVTSSIAESLAMLLGTDIDSRFATEAEAKRLYGIRSKVAHHGKSDVDFEDLIAVQHIAREAIMKLLTSVPLESVKDGIELQKTLKSFKYSCKPL